MLGCDTERLRQIEETPPPAPTPEPCADAATVTCGVGMCGGQAEPVCSDGLFVCQDPTPPAPEVCDRIDNDCDGTTDENLFSPCMPELACSPGIERCGDKTCFFAVFPEPEVCDGLDNNCDGLVDEGVSVIPGCCTPEAPELCDGLDNNCNGVTDEGLRDACGNCPGEGPEEEPCNGLDDDCDGLVDEDDLKHLEVAIYIDSSGSNFSRIGGQKAALQAAVRKLGAEFGMCLKWDVGEFPNGDPFPPAVTHAVGVDAAGADAALARIGGISSGLDEWSYDVLVYAASAREMGAVRSIILVADEEGQSGSGRQQYTVGVSLRAVGVEVLTMTGWPYDYYLLGPTIGLNDDLQGAVVDFVRRRAQ